MSMWKQSKSLIIVGFVVLGLFVLLSAILVIVIVNNNNTEATLDHITCPVLATNYACDSNNNKVCPQSDQVCAEPLHWDPYSCSCNSFPGYPTYGANCKTTCEGDLQNDPRYFCTCIEKT